MKRLPPYHTGMYAGLNYRDASLKATEVCRIAADSGQTILAIDHLIELAAIMQLRRAA